MKHYEPNGSPFTPEDFQKATNVSRETLERLQAYAELLVGWNGRMNLVAKSTIIDLWHRHMLDSAQVWNHLSEDTKTLVDMGAGAGFPGLVLAIMGADQPDFHVHLIESTGKKVSFLQAVAEMTGVSVTIHKSRIEALAPFQADVVTARALAPLDKLIGYGQRFAGPHTRHIYLKGLHVADELTQAHKIWKMKVDRQPSTTDPRGSVLCVSEVSSVQSGRIQSPSSPPV